MLIRIHRATVEAGRDWEFSQGIREKAIPEVEKVEGIEYSVFGRRFEGQRHQFINVTLWRDYDAIRQHTGEDVQTRLIFDGESEMIVESTVEYYEAFGATDPEELAEGGGRP